MQLITLLVLAVFFICLIYKIVKDRNTLEQKNYELYRLKDELSTLQKRDSDTQSQIKYLKDSLSDALQQIDELKKEKSFYNDIESVSETLNTQDSSILQTQEIVRPNTYKKTYSSDIEFIKELYSLDQEQTSALDIITNTNNNCFITGKAGTGKSYLLEVFKNTSFKKNLVVAPTGIAALNIDGATIHSVFGYNNIVTLSIEDITEEKLKLKSEKIELLCEIDTLIIDEVSMIRADTFDKIDKILKVVNNSDKPFGGKQIVLFGDVFQLPPIAKKAERDFLMDRYGGIYFFDSFAFANGKFNFIELTINHRQSEDAEFFNVLNRIREGTVTNQDLLLLNTRIIKDESIYDRFTAILPQKAEVENINNERISLLKTKEYVYHLNVTLNKYPNQNRNLEALFPILKDLKLKVGALVMMVSNDPEKRWANGTLGIVKKLEKDHIWVSINGQTYEILPTEFTEQEAKYEKKKIVYEDTLTIVQYPLVPAYAITIHKSQGQTYNNIICDIDKCFEKGQAYVALSRCKSLNGLHLRKRITRECIRIDQRIVDFYQLQRESNSNTSKTQ